MADAINTDQLINQMRQMIAQAQSTQSTGAMNNPAEAGSTNEFSSLLNNAVKTVSDNQFEASGLQEKLMSGDPNVSALEVFVSMEKASVSFQAMVEVRNKLVSAYQEIMNMQI